MDSDFKRCEGRVWGLGQWSDEQIDFDMTLSTVQPVYRFAPSPNGYLHLGHAYSALLNFERAQKTDGRFLLRIEDIDRGRSRPEFEHAIYEDLAWLGITWEEPVLRQSEHLAFYADAIATLDKRGLLYPCFCTRSERMQSGSALKDPDGAPLYSGQCRHFDSTLREEKLNANMPHVNRLDMERALKDLSSVLTFEEFGADMNARMLLAQPERWGDAMMARKDVPTSYHVSVVLDDARQGITDVIRGADLLASTDLHRLLQALFDLRTPRYHHHDLILDMDGDKLAKSKGSKALRDLRAEGVTPTEIRARLGFS
jgi:glutamyl-Q tRNA(Asp) synthetase